MTAGRNMKRRVRERMKETGENYTRALREIRAEHERETEQEER